MIQPSFIGLQSWASSLIIDYPFDEIPTLSSDAQWREWGDRLILCDSFTVNNSPGTQGFNKWEDWAQAVYYTQLDN